MPNVDCSTLTSDVGDRPPAGTACPARCVSPLTPLPDPGQPLSVLVVGDVDDAADRLARSLGRHGFPALAVATGEDALSAAAASLADVVILFLPLAAADGWDLARRMSAGRGPTAVRPFVVAVVTGGAEEDRRRAAEANVDLVLVAPVEAAVVVGVLRRFARAVAPGRAGAPGDPGDTADTGVGGVRGSAPR